jgi:four helix bundle protein
MRSNIVREKSFDFALVIIRLYCKLRDEREHVISKQLLRSGTSIGANIEEGSALQSRNDFISKMSIASKEARETRYWLRLLQQSDLTRIDVRTEPQQVDEIIRLLRAIVKTASSPRQS